MYEASQPHAIGEPARATRPSVLWTLHLLATIVFIGLPGCLLIVPFILLGRWYRPLELAAGRAACGAIRLMFSLNIWLKKDVRLSVPFSIGRRPEGCLMVANHRSNLDVFFLISYVPNIRIVAKRALFFVPFLGPMMWVMRQIPIQRGRFHSFIKVLEDIRDGLDNGDPVLVFPEGRRGHHGQRGTLPFQAAVFKFAFDRGEAITPIVFANTDRVWPKGSFGIDPSYRVTFTSLPPMHPRDFADHELFRDAVRQAIDRCLERLT